MAKSDEDIVQRLNQTLENIKKAASDFEKSTEGVTAEQRQGLKEEIKLLEKKLKLLNESETATQAQKDEAKETLDAIILQNKHLKQQHQVTGRIGNELASTGQKYKDFLMTTSAQYNLAQEIAKEYRGLVKTMGLGGKSAEHMTDSFKDVLPDILEMGLKQEDLGRIYQEMADASGRITPLSPEDAEAIGAIAAGTGIMASDAANMGESFRLMGVSGEKMEEHVKNVYEDAQAMGLNATKVIKVLQQNMRSMQSYSFAGGVKGMTSMAKQAVKMRIDVSDVLQMADKFYQPEAAIEAAANLQMLGGDIAEAFGDPFETMYLARNKPEELAKKLEDMTENMMQFNSETGEYEFPAEVRMQLKSAGEQLGINTDKMIEMARQSSKIKDLKMKFTSIGDEETAENLASLAEFKDGKYTIKHDGQELGLDQINEGMAEDIMKANQSSDDTFRDIAINTQTMSEKLTSFLDSQKARAVTGINMYELTVAEMEKPLAGLRDGMISLTEKYVKKGGVMIKNMFATDQPGGIVKDTVDQLGKLGKLVEDKTIKSFSDLSEKVNFLVEKLPETPEVNTDPTKPNPEINDMVSLPGSEGRVLSGPFGSFSLNDRDLIMAGDPKKLAGGENTSSVSGTIDVNFNNAVITVKSSGGGEVAMDMDKIKDAIQPIIINAINNKSRNGGVLSSKEAVDNGLTV